MPPEPPSTISTAITYTLPASSQAARSSLTDEERTFENHARLLASLDCLTQIEAGQHDDKKAPLAFPFTVAAWNLERCLFPQESAAKIAEQNARLVLLSEMDSGMARTLQVNTPREVASRLGMGYLFGVEFLELGLGSPIEHSFCTDDFNEKGFHGNALLSAAPMSSAFRLNLPGRAHWFIEKSEQQRVGDRIAVGAIVETEQGPLLAVSTHLESVADGTLSRAANGRHYRCC